MTSEQLMIYRVKARSKFIRHFRQNVREVRYIGVVDDRVYFNVYGTEGAMCSVGVKIEKINNQ